MSKPAVYLITFIVCIALQVAVAPAIAIGGCSPNFLLIPVLLVAMRSGACSGGVSGFCCGLFEDFVGNGTVGCMALTLTLVAFAVGLLAANMGSSSALVSCIFGVASSVVVELFYGLANVLTSADGGGVLATLAGHSLPQAVYTLVFVCIALTTIRLVLPEEMTGMPSRLGGGVGASSRSIFR